MHELSVLKVKDPSCFFCEVLKDNGHAEYEQLFQDLNFLYGKMYRDVEELKPVSLPVGAFCVVYCEQLQSWCRAILESPTCSAQNEVVECFLLDHALNSPIRKRNIRFPVKAFERLPFRARKFKLHQIEPVSLHFCVYENKSVFRLAKNWDYAAIQYFQQLLNESTKIEAQFCSVEDSSVSVYLYITTKDAVLCVNDDLVAKKYGCYTKESSAEKIESSESIHPLVEDIQFQGYRNGNTLLSPGKESEHQTPTAATNDGFLWPTWTNLSHAQRLATEAVQKSADEIRIQMEGASVVPDKDLGCEQGGTFPPLERMFPFLHVGEKESVFCSSERELQPSDHEEHDPVPCPVPLLSVMDNGSQLTPDSPRNSKAETSGSIDEIPDPPVKEEPVRENMQLTAPACTAFLWPAWTTAWRQSEIMENSFTKTSSLHKEIISNKEDNDFMSLLKFLNPGPVQVSEDDPQTQNTKKLQYPVVVSSSLISFSTLESSCLYTDIKQRMMTSGYDGPNLAESYCWAPIAEGFDTIVISPGGSNPMCYVPPLLTYLHCASVVYKLLPAKHGPYAVIVCPGWDKAHAVYNLLMDYSKCIRKINPLLLLVGVKKEEIGRINFRRPCEVIVTTPHSLLRCLEHDGLLLLRLCHLVLDEVDVLFSKAGPEISAIVETYKKISPVDDTPQQIVAVGSTWTRDIELLLQYTSSPRIIITRMEQAAVASAVHQVIHMCLDCDKLSLLLQCLDFVPVNSEKIIIFTTSEKEAELVHNAVKTSSTYSLLLHKKLVHNFNNVLEQWKKVCGCGTVVTLVITDDYTPIMEITDATCIIHYGFPENNNILSLRLFSLLDYIQNKIDQSPVVEQDSSRAKSILLMTEKNAYHAVDILNFLQQAQATIPPELLNLTHGILQAKEKTKSHRELCQYLKVFGYCTQDKFSCPNRHQINPSLDFCGGISPIPETSMYIMVLPLYVEDATRFYGRIVTKNDPYEGIVAQLNVIYQSLASHLPVKEVRCDELYAIKDESTYHRVLVLSIRTVDSNLYTKVQYIDSGKIDEVPGHQLLPLPPEFHTIPPQCVEFIVCRVKPIDNEDKWDPQVSRIINRKIKGKHHRAKVVLILGRTYWLDPMVQVSTLSGLSTCVYELNVRQEILSTGLGTDNPQHVLQLQSLLEPSGTSPVIGRSEELTSDDETRDPSPPLPVDTAPDEPVEEASDEKPQMKLPPTSLHPEVRWFEKDDVVILTVKLRDITNHKCAFYKDRVVFSCEANGKDYGADLALHREIVTEKSQCLIKNGEAVITLRKAELQPWEKLLTTKHPNVSFDFDHLEDSEDIEWLPSYATPSKHPYHVMTEDTSSECSESDSD